MRCSKRARRVVGFRQGVVHSAISTKSCGQVCGLSLNSLGSRSRGGRQDGRDQKLSSVLRWRNMSLPERIGLRDALQCRCLRETRPCGYTLATRRRPEATSGPLLQRSRRRTDVGALRELRRQPILPDWPG
jgi:hypothetical protein